VSRAIASTLLPALLVAGCSEPDAARRPDEAPSPSTPPPSSPGERGRAGAPEPGPAVTREARPQLRPGDLDLRRAEAVVSHLAGGIGPRHATGPAFARAADWVSDELRKLGYQVSQQPVDVPGGTSWGVPVPAGESVNVVATPRGFDPTAPHLLVGAHLDTVPQSPGAEDNASGVGVLLAAAAAVAEARTRLPVVWVAFGAEEPRGAGDDDHHYGSRAYVEAVAPAQRRALRAMVSLDRVGVGATVPVGSTGDSDPVQRGLLDAARRAGVPAYGVRSQRSSDHWSFVRAGLPGARLGSTSYAGYHSPADRPGVVDPAQLERTGRLLLAWLAPTP
jgi:hypothetical protein